MTRWLRRGLVGALLVWIAVLAVQCEQPTVDAVEEASGPHTVYVVRHGWHAGLVMPRAALGDAAWPVLGDFPPTAYVEVGWGEAAYYPNPDAGLGTLLRAGLWPTKSVVHMAVFDEPVTDAFPQHDIAAIQVSRAGLHQVAAFVRQSMHNAHPDPVASGHYHESAFFLSRLPYHGLNNCNQWAAHALRAAGCDMVPTRTLRVTRLMHDAQSCGRWIQSAP
ncbi:hypothetical protein CRI93_03080 [Longimonas halophila]|uniref:TIGR02117 family protein n=1 Tax=Longimonas halophila TaxID=1469170 RepID=A0A2H3NNZ0_9BACT|nr:DUF2459 domain-containing protein [Longimonas halophila]PEN08754.1 hypothetical protein CRI93_03080 [Longimonas halophila]